MSDIKRLPLILADGEHYISTPTFATLQLLEDQGIDVAAGVDLTKAKNVNIVVAGMLTAEEPIIDGVPERTWHPLEAGHLITNDLLPGILKTLATVIRSAFADASPDGDKRPTRASRGAGKP